MSRVTDPDLLKLPKWAQTHIDGLERRIEDLEAELKAVRDEHPRGGQLRRRRHVPAADPGDAAVISPYARAISLLIHAARVDPVLRDAVRTVERHVAHIENTVLLAIEALDAEHAPLGVAQAGRRGGCVMCWPKDGSWPCHSRMVVDDLRALFHCNDYIAPT